MLFARNIPSQLLLKCLNVAEFSADADYPYHDYQITNINRERHLVLCVFVGLLL